MKINHSQINKILVIQLRAIGDVVLTTPVFSVLRKHFPQAEIHFLTSKNMAGLVQRLPEINRVLIWPSSYWALTYFYAKILLSRYQLVIDYQCTPGSALTTWFTRSSYRIGWKMERRQWAYNLYSTANTRQEYVPVQKCRALELVGIKELNTKLQIITDPAAQKIVNDYFKVLKIDHRGLIVNITPKGKRPARQWSPEKIIKLTDYLSQTYHAAVFYNWAGDELKYVKEISQACHPPPFILPAWPLTVFSAYLSQVDVHISYDNGPKHVAIAVGTPTISLFATDSPVLWNPLDNPYHPYILAQVPCRFCRLKKCPLMICMKSIEVSDVIKVLEEIPALQDKIKNNAYPE